MVVMTELPARSQVQRMDALRRANEVRSYRAGLKVALSRGVSSRSVADVIAAPLELEESWPVLDLLLVVPRIGRVRANRLLARERISSAKTVGGLTERQRRALVVVLTGSVGRR